MTELDMYVTHKALNGSVRKRAIFILNDWFLFEKDRAAPDIGDSGERNQGPGAVLLSTAPFMSFGEKIKREREVQRKKEFESNGALS
jgi:hypothetical protein